MSEAGISTTLNSQPVTTRQSENDNNNSNCNKDKNSKAKVNRFYANSPSIFYDNRWQTHTRTPQPSRIKLRNCLGRGGNEDGSTAGGRLGY